MQLKSKSRMIDICTSTSFILLSFLFIAPVGSFSLGRNYHGNRLSRTSQWNTSGGKGQGYPRIRSSQLRVKWFGGSSQERSNGDELLGVKIERTSPNSRRIAGEIIIPKPMDDVWAILTDYDNLATHVPNLVESRRVGPSSSTSVQGDGNYKCKLYQKGAQKIVGFEFGASVTMEMTENIRLSNVVTPRLMKLGREKKIQTGEQRRINFKCVESQFFSEFDGEWKCTWIDDPNDAFEVATKVEYVVDVRPRGPVPVQALEWRIREDVPTNLRAVKIASVKSGKAGVMKMRGESYSSSLPVSSTLPDRISRISAQRGDIAGARTSVSFKNDSDSNSINANFRRNEHSNDGPRSTEKKSNMSIHVKWYDDETMATYLEE